MSPPHVSGSPATQARLRRSHGRRMSAKRVALAEFGRCCDVMSEAFESMEGSAGYPVSLYARAPGGDCRPGGDPGRRDRQQGAFLTYFRALSYGPSWRQPGRACRLPGNAAAQPGESRREVARDASCRVEVAAMMAAEARSVAEARLTISSGITFFSTPDMKSLSGYKHL